MERFDISAEFRRRVTSRGENQNGYDISSGKAEGRVFHAINLTLHFSLVLLHHFATFKSPPSLSLVFLLFQRLLHSFQLVSLRATPYYLSYVNEFRLIIQQDGVRKGKKRGMRVPFGTHGTERRDIAASVTVKAHLWSFAWRLLLALQHLRFLLLIQSVFPFVARMLTRVYGFYF